MTTMTLTREMRYAAGVKAEPKKAQMPEMPELTTTKKDIIIVAAVGLTVLALMIGSIIAASKGNLSTVHPYYYGF